MERGEVEIGRRPPRWRLAHIEREPVTRLRQLLAQRRRQGLIFRALRLDRVGGRGRLTASFYGAPHHREHLLIAGDDFILRRDLRAQAGDQNGLAHDVAGEREIGGVDARLLRCDARLIALERAAAPAEEIEIEANRGADRIERERGAWESGKAKGLRINALANGGAGGVHLR